MSLTAQDMAQAINLQCFVDADVVEEIRPMATYVLGAMSVDPTVKAEVKQKLLTGLKAAQAQIPALIEQIEAL